MDLQTILSSLFANASAVGIEGVFQFVFAPHLAYWSEIRNGSRTEAGRHASAGRIKDHRARLTKRERASRGGGDRRESQRRLIAGITTRLRRSEQ